MLLLQRGASVPKADHLVKQFGDRNEPFLTWTFSLFCCLKAIAMRAALHSGRSNSRSRARSAGARWSRWAHLAAQRCRPGCQAAYLGDFPAVHAVFGTV